jgi:hypothetical protein
MRGGEREQALLLLLADSTFGSRERHPRVWFARRLGGEEFAPSIDWQLVEGEPRAIQFDSRVPQNGIDTAIVEGRTGTGPLAGAIRPFIDGPEEVPEARRFYADEVFVIERYIEERAREDRWLEVACDERANVGRLALELQDRGILSPLRVRAGLFHQGRVGGVPVVGRARRRDRR